MRDVVVVFYFAIMLALSLGRPHIGLPVWIWTALVTPNALVFGFAGAMRYNLIAASLTIVSWLIYSRKPSIKFESLAKLAIIFYIWTVVTTVFAIHSASTLMFMLGTFTRGMLLFLFALLIINRKSHCSLVAWAVVLSIGLHSSLGGLKYIANGGAHKVVGPLGSMLLDNNHMALAINMMLPFGVYLLKESRSFWLRICLIGFLFVSCIAVVGTNSRGGFVGMLLLLIAWIVLSKRKKPLIIAVIIFSTIALNIVPQSYFDRVETISTGKEDASFGSRIVAWKMSTLIALDNPITGGGFHAVQTYAIWQEYSKKFHLFDFIETEHASLYNFKAAHSIYFQVLSDHGFVGLAIYLSLLFWSCAKAFNLSRQHKNRTRPSWICDFAMCCLLSLLAFCVSGASLSMAYFELAFLNVALVCTLGRIDSENKSSVSNSQGVIRS